MDTGTDFYQVGSSFRREGSSRNRSNGSEVFSTQSWTQEDDEEALRWAALEKLPTYNRLRKGLLTGSRGLNEVDIKDLGFQEKKILIDNLVHVAEEDNEKFLSKLKDRIERVGLQTPTIEVRFDHLCIEGKAQEARRALPTFINFATNTIEGLLHSLRILPSPKKPITILHDVCGIIKPKRLTLLLGPPSSGKTTLLLALAGKLDKNLKVSGSVTYNGHEMREFVPQRTAAYISQHDVHLRSLTVRETLAYSARFQGVGHKYDMLVELSRREKEARIKPDPDIDLFMKALAAEGQKENIVTDYTLKILGLDICADTIVGDQMLRGISGGQRKRVTTGEMIVGPYKALFMDEISTGLDSSTTFQIVNAIRQSVHILEGTVVVSLLQPPPETYELFDDIILLSDGMIVYNGPRENVLEFFEYMGFRCPKRKGVADFLQEVTSRKDQQQYWVDRDQPYRFITAKEFAEAFQSFHVGQKIQDELAVPFDKTKSHPAALTTKKYGVGKKEILKASFSREWLLMKRASFIYIFQSTKLFLTVLVAMTVFLRTKMDKDTVNGGTVYSGSLFFGLTNIMFSGMAELSMTTNRLPVFYKQRDFLFYPAWAYALPTWLIKIPTTIIDVSLWVFPSYYVIGYDPNVGRLFKQFLVLIFVNQTTTSLFRFIGAAARSVIIANTFGACAIFLVFALGGFVLSRVDVKKWWIWGYYISPLMYANTAIVVNEFLGKSWSRILPGTTEPLGVSVLKSRGYFTDAYWFWLGLGALVGFMILFNILYILSLTFLKELGKKEAIIHKEPAENNDGKENELERRDENKPNTSSTGSSITTTAGTTKIRAGINLPFEPHSLTFDNVRYSVDMPSQMKSQGVTEDRLELLKGVSGAFRPGVLTALMGVSGAGKTTLMDVLAGRKNGGYVEGDILVSGYPKKQETFARISGYCEQNDIHSPHVTVYESLVYSAWLRLSSDIDAKTRKNFVDEVMELVELTPLMGAIVGLPGVNGLSTEQRKRLTIAVELVANPSIIFMDEPTSGLDARAAAIVMRTVRNTVDTGRTVVCTIHQPSIDIFESFDELFLMKRGGEEIYVGPLGHNSVHLINYFEGIRGVPKIKDGYNPATWMLEVTSAAQESALGVDFTQIYKNSDLCRRNKDLIRELSNPRPGSKDLHFSTQYAQPFFTQCMACLWKQHWSYWRNTSYTAIRFYFTAILGLVIGSMFWGIGGNHSNRKDLFNAMGASYSAVVFIGVQNAATVQSVVNIDRTVFYRERAAGMYSALPYAFSQVIIELPYIFALATAYGVIVYSMMQFEWTASRFLWYLYFLYFTWLYYTFYGMMVVAMSPNQQISSIVSSACYSLFSLFSGFTIPKTRLPIWWKWYWYICPVAWSLYGLIVSQFGEVHDVLEDVQVPVSEFIKDYFGYHYDFLGAVAGIVVGFAVLFATVFAIAIKVLNFQKR